MNFWRGLHNAFLIRLQKENTHEKEISTFNSICNRAPAQIFIKGGHLLEKSLIIWEVKIARANEQITSKPSDQYLV